MSQSIGLAGKGGYMNKDYMKKYLKDFGVFEKKKKKLWDDDDKIDKILNSYIKHEEEVTPMTRKHFKMIAKVVAAIDDKDVREQVALNFANEIRDFNPRFDMQRFVEACCVQEGK